MKGTVFCRGTAPNFEEGYGRGGKSGHDVEETFHVCTGQLHVEYTNRVWYLDRGITLHTELVRDDIRVSACDGACRGFDIEPWIRGDHMDEFDPDNALIPDEAVEWIREATHGRMHPRKFSWEAIDDGEIWTACSDFARGVHIRREVFEFGTPASYQLSPCDGSCFFHEVVLPPPIVRIMRTTGKL